MQESISRLSAVALLCFFGATQALAQTESAEAATSATSTANPARALLQSKCLQCHTDSIWRDQRQDARAWEATLYRMMARGAVWSGEDIKTMASYLATDFGPDAPRTQRPARP